MSYLGQNLHSGSSSGSGHLLSDTAPRPNPQNQGEQNFCSTFYSGTKLFLLGSILCNCLVYKVEFFKFSSFPYILRKEEADIFSPLSVSKL